MKVYDFYSKRIIFLSISVALIAIGLICNVIFGTVLSIEFSGGATVTYSYTGELDLDTAQSVAEEALDTPVTISRGTELEEESEELNTITVSLAGQDTMSDEQLGALTTALQEEYPDGEVVMAEMRNVNPTVGRSFFLKGLYVLALSGVFMVIYLGIRFRKIGGWSAGAFALLAVIHDVIIVYFFYVVCRIPLDDNFIAVVLTILGYSLNDTIIVYDRIRENRGLMGAKATDIEVMNTSMSETIRRSINTSVATFLAIATVGVVCYIMGVTSVTSFAIPMSFGIIIGCYSSVSVAVPMWLNWVKWRKSRKEKKELKQK